MARPQKQTVDYFPHFSNASNGKTLYILESKFGNDGYAFWFKLLELLASSAGHVSDVRNPPDWEFLLAKTHVDNDKAHQILYLLVELGAIDAELWTQGIIWVQNLVDNIADAYRNRTGGIPPKPSFNGQKPSSTGVSDVRNTDVSEVSDVRNTQIKEKKIKENKRKIYNIPDFIDNGLWIDFLEMRRKARKEPTDRAKELLIKDLERHRDDGDDPNEILKQSIKNCWLGLFPLKKEGQVGQHKGNSKSVPGNRPAGAFDDLED